MTVEFDKVDLLEFATMMKVLLGAPCYLHVGDSVRVRMCRFCSDVVLDVVAEFALHHIRRGWAAEPPPHEDPLAKELEELPY